MSSEYISQPLVDLIEFAVEHGIRSALMAS